MQNFGFANGGVKKFFQMNLNCALKSEEKYFPVEDVNSLPLKKSLGTFCRRSQAIATCFFGMIRRMWFIQGSVMQVINRVL